jgi:DNA mismatch endonuclease (patch repair protein)
MTDIYSKETRSYIMSQVKSKNTTPELLVRKFLFSKGIRYRLHKRDLPGKPDVVICKYKTVIFINGCFWHGHEGCRYYKTPKTNTEFWIKKINKNITNDNINVRVLQDMGWKVLTVWGCEIKPKYLSNTLALLIKNILN